MACFTLACYRKDPGLGYQIGLVGSYSIFKDFYKANVSIGQTLQNLNDSFIATLFLSLLMSLLLNGLYSEMD